MYAFPLVNLNENRLITRTASRRSWSSIWIFDLASPITASHWTANPDDLVRCLSERRARPCKAANPRLPQRIHGSDKTQNDRDSRRLSSLRFRSQAPPLRPHAFCSGGSQIRSVRRTDVLGDRIALRSPRSFRVYSTF